MGLTLTGHRWQAAHAYSWLKSTQRPDGSWPSQQVRGRITDSTADANFAAYVAVGVWLDVLVTGDDVLARHMWPTVDRAVEFALGLQHPSGAIWWARDDAGQAYPQALVTASSGVLLSLRCASALADLLEHPRPDWELAATDLAASLRQPSPLYAPAGRHSMDWYWPVLAGAVSGEFASARLADGWQRYVVDGVGVRCVDDRPWVTAAESAELALALTTCGEVERASAVLESVEHLRDDDGAYWTGYVWTAGVRWPVERTTWSAGAVLMANDALRAESPMHRLLATRLDLIGGAAVRVVTP